MTTLKIPTFLNSTSCSVLLSNKLDGRPRVKGKFIFAGDKKLYIRGVTYGPFRPDQDGNKYHDPVVVERDFTQMAANGLNAVRTYTVPPRWFLDAAQRQGLGVMVGLPMERQAIYLDGRGRARLLEEQVRAGVSACAGHPSVLCYTIGNEIRASIVRWHGHRRIERCLEHLYRAAKAEDPEGLVTYVNYPSTEYLQLPFIDFVSFNVYLESQERLEAYLARLHNIAGDRPLVMTEIGLDSHRHGEDAQARALDWQVRTAFAAGCAGAFVFAWTDEWFAGGSEVEDWDFGLTGRDRRPKPALAAVREAFAEAPFPPDLCWPCISVVVCSYNGERTIRDCFEGLLKLEYPNFEVIVVDDGSTDATAAITREYGFRLISTENRGLSSARNTGLEAATGESVAYIDDDARPDPHWLTYLATTFMSTKHAGVGGPNIAPPGDGPIADCVANAPGNPVHVLLSDREAEHIPGCNMAFRKACLEAIGGFDAQFRVAGDDVDVCWRLQQRGWSLGFSPAAMVRHHRRNSVRAYWRQQWGYGQAEGQLERKWPEKYNAVGHLTWAGRLYGKGLIQALGLRGGRIYHGIWGSALFQSVYQPAPDGLCLLPMMPEWYLIIATLAAITALGISWNPLLLASPLLGFAIGAPLIQAGLSAARATFTNPPQSRTQRLRLHTLTAFLHLLQPLARLYGHLRSGLTPWRRRGMRGLALPWPQACTIWSERWQASDERLRSVEAALRAAGAVVLRGGDYDRCDLEVRGGMLGAARMCLALEDHDGGRQLVRFRTWPRCSPTGLTLPLLFAALSTGAALDRAWVACAILSATALPLALLTLQECAAATATLIRALRAAGEGEPDARLAAQDRQATGPVDALPSRACAVEARAVTSSNRGVR
jgi:GT2 family glycosyltransferase